MTIASFFSGIGGFEVGLERAGLGPTVFQCERDPYALKILEKHWPGVQRHDDITALEPSDIPHADIWCGGPPCQDLSDAGTGWSRPGLSGGRSGLAHRWLDLIGRCRPQTVIWENVDGGAWRRWVPVVRRILAGIGYASVPFRLRAEDVGAPFRGSRIFLVASADLYRQPSLAFYEKASVMRESSGDAWKDWGEPSPTALGMADGIPRRVDRLRCVGNAVVPDCAEAVGRRVMEMLS